jgi:hypothetical protein
MFSTCWHQPGIPRFESHCLALHHQFCLSGKHVPNRLVVSSRRRFSLWLFLLPQPHRDAFTGDQIGLVDWAVRRSFAADLFYGGVTRHWNSCQERSYRCSCNASHRHPFRSDSCHRPRIFKTAAALPGASWQGSLRPNQKATGEAIGGTESAAGLHVIRRACPVP